MAAPPLVIDPLSIHNSPVPSIDLTSDVWRASRRPALLQTFAEHVYGVTPLQRPDSLRFVVRETKADALNGLATRLRVGILFEGTDPGRQMELLVYLPNAANGPVPLFLGLNFDGNFSTTPEPDLPLPRHYVNGLFTKSADHRPTEALRGHHANMFPYEAILKRGYGIATAAYGEIEPDEANNWWHGPRVLAPPTQPNSWGTIGTWAWALSRALDYLETNPAVDKHRVAVYGFSRLGKTAMWAGAQDERFAAVISQNSGKGGASQMKRPVGEPVAHLVKAFSHWFAPNFAQFSDNESELPVDGGDIAALIAPRPLLILSATEDTWSDPEGEFLSAQAASPIYEMLGVQGLDAERQPAPQTLINSRIGYYLRTGKHNVTAEDWSATLDWADVHLKTFLTPTPGS